MVQANTKWNETRIKPKIRLNKILVSTLAANQY